MDDVEGSAVDVEGTRTQRIRTPGARGGTYRTLDEQAGRLSAAEERFERGRRTLGLFLAPTVFLVLLVVPLGLTRPQQNLAAVLGLVFVLWITEAIPIPVSGIIGVCLCVMLRVTEEPDDIFASFSNSTVFLFIGSFIIAEAMLVHHLDRRLAFNVLSMGFVGSSTTLSRGERNTLVAFTVAVVGWSLPGVVGLLAGDDSALYGDVSAVLDEGVVAIIAAGLLFVIPVSWQERKFTLNWNQAARIDWGTILLFGSGIALGSLMSKTGLAKKIGEELSDALNVSGLLAITVLVVVVAVLISETTSNTASAAIVVPIAIVLAGAVNVDPIIPAVAAIFGANYGFMLPVSTPPNAIVYSSGYLPITRMIKAGAVFDVIGAVLCIVGVTVMARLVGLAG
ncbi:MAG: SLC13 family permease [Actinomycetota bacterium]|nr:SLC13 family permease [Actinomycetota bacterium]